MMCIQEGKILFAVAQSAGVANAAGLNEAGRQIAWRASAERRQYEDGAQ
jgi:hypothetical protein